MDTNKDSLVFSNKNKKVNSSFDIVEYDQPDTSNMSRAGKRKLAKQNSANEHAIIEVFNRTNQSRLADQAEAAKRESKAFWDAKSVETATRIKASLQAEAHNIENELCRNKMEAMEKAYSFFNDKVIRIKESTMYDESVKERLIEKLVIQVEATVEKIENDYLASKYDLVD